MTMAIDRIVMALAGTVVLVGLTLTHVQSPYWLKVPTGCS